MRLKAFLIIAIVVALGLIGLLYVRDNHQAVAPQTSSEIEPAAPAVIAENLDVPWDVAFLPGGDLLITERAGVLRRKGVSEATYTVPGVVERGEGGLHGVAIHPNFAENALVYLYFTTVRDDETINRVVRFTLRSELREDRVIIDAIPGGRNHNGGRIAFGPDGMLYVATGDGGVEEQAQDRASLAGKILRVRDDGSIPDDNPFGTAVWSYGHRNPQGLTWDAAGRLWATEHGRSGVRSGFDEINHIERGANYGWPVIQGDATREGMRTPALHSGPSTTWAPAGIAHVDGRLYFAGLRGEALYEVAINEQGMLTEPRALLQGTFGRLRAVALYAGDLYVSTSNRDGRGDARTGDDRLLRLTL